VLAVGPAPSPALAQPETRSERIAAQEAERAKEVTPPVPSRLERIAGLLDGPAAAGFVPAFGNLIEGASFNLGAGYRRFFGDTSHWLVHGTYSVRNFFMVEGLTRFPTLARGRLAVDASASLKQGPEVEFYGIGPDSLERDRSVHFERRVDVGVQARYRPLPLLVLGAGTGFQGRDTDPASDPRSIERVFTPEEAPGLNADVPYGHVMASAGLDWRNAASYADRGGLAEVAVHTFRDPDRRYSFNRVDTDLVQHIPILRGNWIISLRGSLSAVDPHAGQDVPYFMLPRSGGSRGVRGYASARYRDRSAAVASAEYRWTPGEVFEMAVFYDLGVVASTTTRLRLDDRHDSWGFGARFHSPSRTVLRVELGFGDEGPHVIFSFSPAF
jgi:hypothetical protein